MTVWISGMRRFKGIFLKEFLLLLLLAPLLLSACAPPAVKTTMLVPGKFHEAAIFKEIAVLPFEGKNGREFSAEIEAVLSNVNINDKQYFTLIDRVRIAKLMEELSLSQTGLVDPQSVVRVGKMLGAKGVYTGTVTQANVDQTNWTERRTECTSYEDSKKFFKKCLSQREYNVQCAKRIAWFEFTPKLTEVETGRVVYANKVSGTSNSAACKDSATSIASEFNLLQAAKQLAVNRFRSEIAPYYVTFSIQLMESSEGIASTEAEKKFRSGLDYAKKSRLDRACELWGEARVASPSSPSILYSLGICAEATGDAEAAVDLYRKADKLLNRPDDKITIAISRCADAMKHQQKLKEQIAK